MLLLFGRKNLTKSNQIDKMLNSLPVEQLFSELNFIPIGSGATNIDIINTLGIKKRFDSPLMIFDTKRRMTQFLKGQLWLDLTLHLAGTIMKYEKA